MEKFIKEFKETLEVEKENLSIYEGREDVTNDFHNASGWVEALEYVIRILENPLYNKED
tara:strand:- start:203 stop:379 length:177 start_codon:yes stop_codon:yes gene_type:complete